MSSRPVIHYLPFAGRAEATRLCFAVGKIEWDECKDDMKTLKEKSPTGLLPWMEVDGKAYAQSHAMMYYAAKRGGLFPECPCDLMQATQIVQCLEDAMVEAFAFYKHPEGEERDKMQKECLKKAGEILHATDKIASSHMDAQGHCVGGKVSFADCAIASLFAQISVEASPLYLKNADHQFPNFAKCSKMVFEIPEVVAYKASKKY